MDWKNLYFSFKGRINRQPFWLGGLALTVVLGVLLFAVLALFGTSVVGDDPAHNSFNLSPIGWVIGAVLYIIMIWAGLAMQIKRWHDRDKSGWWVLIGLVPVIGGIWALVETGFLRGTSGANRFGPNPLA